jgi:hypothetical protein
MSTRGHEDANVDDQEIELRRTRLGAMREEAMAARAAEVVPDRFRAAVGAEAQGDRALEQRDRTSALRHYQAAIDAFQRARDDALQAAREVAQPPMLPNRDAGPPQRREPQKTEPVASMAGPSADRKEAERARTEMSTARRAAEQAAANFFAHRLFVSAQAKAADADTAFARSDYQGASRMFGEAQRAYQAASEQAKRQADEDRRLAPLKAALEEARAAVAERRRQAIAAQGDRLAKTTFDRAQARHVEADGLADRQELSAATQAYRDAANRYGDAIRQAEVNREGK